MRRFTLCYDYRITKEYRRLLHYPKFKFTDNIIDAILKSVIRNGICIIPDKIDNIPFEKDETDKKFYEVAKFCSAVLAREISHTTRTIRT